MDWMDWNGIYTTVIDPNGQVERDLAIVVFEQTVATLLGPPTTGRSLDTISGKRVSNRMWLTWSTTHPGSHNTNDGTGFTHTTAPSGGRV